MGGRASIVGAAETNVGKVRDHNEDCHFIDVEAGIFIVCDGMGGHAAGEVASELAVQTIREQWAAEPTQKVVDSWLAQGTHDARKKLIAQIQGGVVAAHDAILAEAQRDRTKGGMGTTLVGAIVVGGDIVFAHCGDSRAYIVRDGIAMQLTEDHTLLARLLAAGVDVDVSGDGARFKSMLTNALGIGQECKVSTFVVPVADGDRFLLCSDGITEYVLEPEIGEVLCKMPSPARAAQKLVEMALDRGGGDNATALVVRVLEAGETSRPAEDIHREEKAIFACPLWANVSPQQRLRALRIALPRDHASGDKVPAHSLGDRVSWIVVAGEVEQDGDLRGPGSLLYPEALLSDRPLPDKDALAIARDEVSSLAIRADDFRELCEEDPELGEVLLAALASEIGRRRPQRRTGRIVVQVDAESSGNTDPAAKALPDDAVAADAPTEEQTRDQARDFSEPEISIQPVEDADAEVAAAAAAKVEPNDEAGDAQKKPNVAEAAAARAAAAVASTDPQLRTIPAVPGIPPIPAIPKLPAVPAAASSSRTKSRPLIVPKEDRAAADAAFDNALAKVTTDEGSQNPAPVTEADSGAHEVASSDSDAPAQVIEVEAEPPERMRSAQPARRPSRPVLGDHSDAEISIESLVENVDNVVELDAGTPTAKKP